MMYEGKEVWTQENFSYQDVKVGDYLHTPQHQWGALSGSQGVPCESQRYLHRPGSLPALQKR